MNAAQGFAEWHRQPKDGEWSSHIHSIPLPEEAKDEAIEFLRDPDLGSPETGN